MSFSSKIKNDLSRLSSEGTCCQRAELSGLIRTSGSITLSGFHRINSTIRTENPAVARHIFTLFKKVFHKQTQVMVKKNAGIKRTNTYEVLIEDAREILTDLGIILLDDGLFGISNQVPKDLVDQSCCPRAYMRGVFIGAGSISDPEKGYHLEFILHDDQYATSFIELLSQYGLQGKKLVRKNNHIVYIKESEMIVDFLNIIGAHRALLDFENVRIVKAVKNNVNRIVNCETANINKTLQAAFSQVDAIKLIEGQLGLESLPKGLQEVAKLRLENPDVSLKELGEMLDKPLSKSGVNHRLKKLERIAQDLES